MFSEVLRHLYQFLEEYSFSVIAVLAVSGEEENAEWVLEQGLVCL
jgi:hypothetical protein